MHETSTEAHRFHRTLQVEHHLVRTRLTGAAGTALRHKVKAVHHRRWHTEAGHTVTAVGVVERAALVAEGSNQACRSHRRLPMEECFHKAIVGADVGAAGVVGVVGVAAGAAGAGKRVVAGAAVLGAAGKKEVPDSGDDIVDTVAGAV